MKTTPFAIVLLGLSLNVSLLAEEAEACSTDDVKCIIKENADTSTDPDGGIRTGGAVLKVWMADIQKPGIYCYPSRQAFKLWREHTEKSVSVHFQSKQGKDITVTWQAKKATLVWPKPWPSDGSVYHLSFDAEPSSEWKFKHIPAEFKSEEQRILWMHKNGCKAQLPILINKYCKFVELDECPKR